MGGPLTGLRVLEAGEGKAVAYAGKLLRDLGAECIKLEPPGGDALRRYGPYPAGRPDPERSGLFVWLNGGKRGVSLDLRDPTARATFDDLLDGADVLLHSYQPAAALALGLDASSLRASRPRLIVTAVTPYGSTGPYADWRGYALQSYAGSSVAFRLGEPDDTPLTAPLDLADIQFGGVHAAAATALALVHRGATGQGQFVDVGVTDAVTSGVAGIGFERVVYGGYPPPVRGGRLLGGGIWGIYATKDGNFDAVTLMNRQWHTFLKEVAGDPEWGRRPEFASVEQGALRDLAPAHVEELRGHLADWFRQHTSAEIWEQTRRLRVSFQPVHTIAEVLASDHLAARSFLVAAPGVAPPLRVPGAPYRFSSTPWQPPGAPPDPARAPATTWTVEEGRTDRTAEGAPRDGLPLSGLRVIDLGQVWAGPLLARYLADWGADVIAVETHTRPRALPGVADASQPGAWEWIYRNRRSVQLNLADPRGKELFHGLLATADVMVDNFAARVMPALGLNYEDLLEQHPRLVICALSASGRTGPWADLLSYGPTLTALHGTKSLYGYPDGRLAEDASELDPISAGYGMLAVMAALHHRGETGAGQLIELAQSEAGLCGVAEAIIELEWNGLALGPLGNTHRVLAPHGIYPCAGEDRWIAIACGSDEEWRSLAETAGQPDWLSEDAFATSAARREAREALDQAIVAWTRGQEPDALTARLQAAGVAAFPVFTALDVIADPHHEHRRGHFELCPEFPGDRLYDGNPWRLSAARPRLRRPAPAPGAHNEEVFGELLGLSPAELAELVSEGVVA